MGNARGWTGGAFAAAALAAALPACAAGDVGLIYQLSGEVSYSSGAHSVRAQAFMMVREGDKFTVPAGAQVRVVYFQGGRQESYSGPATFTAGTQHGSAQNGAQPRVAVLPSGVPQRISQTPEMIQIAKLGRSRGAALRGALRQQPMTPQQQAEVRAAQDVYQEMRAGAPVDDVTPELYLYSVLQDRLLYKDMKVVVAEMARRQPESAEIADLVAYVKAKSE